jgi:hypothetical protein
MKWRCSDAFAKAFPPIYVPASSQASAAIARGSESLRHYQKLALSQEVAGVADVPGAADRSGHVPHRVLVTYVVPNFAELYNRMQAKLRRLR